jgi:hypothetical protein
MKKSGMASKWDDKEVNILLILLTKNERDNYIKKITAPPKHPSKSSFLIRVQMGGK